MKTVFLYSLARLGLFAVVLGVLWLIADLTLLTLVAAIVISALLSFLLLGPLREQMVQRMVARTEQRRAKRAGTDENAEDKLS
ncbi:DUF4229 domain-containing protein [Sediminivirga luteola]|uniref:DUF4229 domain-containing protein n=1 Tax=Sediminivirga luteola TaxID=1774748 RepID=A0A8J2TUR4_9MICO|nr:DUF4229 domain-containing protein [Sediminivirga luteola]GGA02232.1 hypothetical protein GCM10011333_00960 [Sediminivirga luteola]